VRTLPTRCPPWNVASLTAHLAATFRRFADLLDRARAGDLHPPFPPDHLPEENLRAELEFSGDPLEQLSLQANRFLGSVGARDEPMANQFGTMPVGLQMMFGLNELAVHHDDLAHAAGDSYRPAEQVVQALVSRYSAVFKTDTRAISGPGPRSRKSAHTSRASCAPGPAPGPPVTENPERI
jgi:uncharacterized protein (TIGR03083 family)